MKILSIEVRDFKAVRAAKYCLDGFNAEIYGRNGSGKTTVEMAYHWTLGGEVGEVRTFKNGVASGQPSVEIEFDGGKLSRSYNGKGYTFLIDGEKTTATAYKSYVKAVTKGIEPQILTRLGYFCTMDKKARRELLMSLCNVTNGAVISSCPELEPLQEILLSGDVKELQLKIKEKIKDQKRIISRINPVIVELNSQNAGVKLESKVEIEAKLSQLQREFAANDEALKKLQMNLPKTSIEGEMKALKAQINVVIRAFTNTQAAFKEKTAKLETLVIKWQKVKNEKCPTCGQLLPARVVASMIEKIESEGREVRHARDECESDMQAQQAEIEDLQRQIEGLQATNAPAANADFQRQLALHIQKRQDLTTAIYQAQQQIEQIVQQEKKQRRIAELSAREKEVSAKLSEFESILELTKTFIRVQCKLIEEGVNSLFEHVKFRMFDFNKDGTLKDTDPACSVMIGGTPYESLSKGEKLKAGLDVIKTLQKHFKVELPIFIDDAESYTSNSAIDLPNQVIKLIAAECELKVEVENKKRKVP